MALAVATHPLAVDQLCRLSPGAWMQATTVVWSALLLTTMASITAWGQRQRAHSRSTSEEQLVEDPCHGSNGALRHPHGVMQTMCVAQGLRALMQTVNSSSELAGYGGKGVYGGRVQILIIEQVLEVGQGIILLAALLLQEGSATWLRSTIEALTHRFSQYIGHGTETMDIQEEPVVVFPEHAFSRSLTPGPTEVRSRQTTEQA